MNFNKTLKRLSLLAFLVPLAFGLRAQSEIEAGIVLEHLKGTLEDMERSLDEHEEFKIDKAPEEWADESSVMLVRYVKYEAFKEYGKEKVRVYSKYRVKLLDQFAINDYSELWFGEQDLIYIKVIKEDGDSYEVDMEDAVRSDSRTEDYLGLSGFSVNVDSYKKIAVPNLEKGDIVQITQVSENVYYSSKKNSLEFYPYPSKLKTLTLGKGVPVYHDIIEFDLESPFRLSFKSLNGAPEIEAVKVDEYGAHYKFHDEMRGRNKSEFWSGGLGYNPSIKFVIAKYYGKDKTLDFAREKMEVLQEVTENDLIQYANRVYREKKKSHSGVYRDFVKQYKGSGIEKNSDYARNFFFYYRTRAFMSKTDRDFSNIAFIADFSRVLNKRNIEYEYLVAVPLTMGGLKSLISMDEMIWAIRIKGNGEIYSRFNAYATPNAMSQHFYGHDIYVIDPARKKSAMAVNKEQLPVPKPEENKIRYAIEVNVSDDFKTLNLKRTIQANGLQKGKYMDFIPSTQLWTEDLKRDGLEPDELEMPKQFYFMEVANDPDRMDDENQRIREGIRADKRKYMENQVERDLNGDDIRVKKVTNVEVVNDGRQAAQSDITIEDEAVVDNLISRSGDYFVLDLGRILGGQFEIRDSEDKTRLEPIYFGYTREYTYEVRLKIPEGMKVGGLDHFNRKVDNEVGSFEVTSEVVDGVLIVTSTKKYKGIEFPKDKWNEVNAFIDAASDVNQSKIILSR